MSATILTTHAALTADAHADRPPGMPASDCEGIVRPIPLGGSRRRPTKTTLVDAQVGEGELGESLPFQLFECDECHHRIPTVVKADGHRRIRNSYSTAG